MHGKNISVGIVGSGRWGGHIMNILHTIDGVSLEWTAGADNWRKMPAVGRVVISSSSLFHCEQAKEFLHRKINVFCEKPAALGRGRSAHELLIRGGDSPLHLTGKVRTAIHKSEIGECLRMPDDFAPFPNREAIPAEQPPDGLSRAGQFL